MFKYYPVTLDQNVIIDYAKMAPPAMLNLSVKADIREAIDEPIFLKAIETTVERLHYARFRLHNVDGTVMQFESDMAEQKLEPVFDAVSYSDEKLAKLLKKWSEEPFPNGRQDVQLYTIRLVRKNNGKHTLFFCAHHSIMDIYAVIFAISYIGKCYIALRDGTELPREGADPGEVAAARNAYIDSEKQKKDFKWWKEKFSTEPQFTSLNGLGGKEFPKKGKWGHDRSLLQIMAKELRYTIPAELVAAINNTALAKNVSPAVYYMLALRTYLGTVCSTDDVTFCSLSIHRATLAQKSSGLSRAAAAPFRSIISGDTAFEDAVRHMDVLNRDYLKHLDFPEPCLTMYRMYDIPDDARYDSVFFSYVPFVDYGAVGLDIAAEKIDSGVSLGPLYILYIPTDTSGDLQAFYTYASGYIRPENIEKYHAFMLKFLTSAIKSPDKTINRLVDESI